MPLPDERPRQSVANLIGRFEKQKSSSGAAAPPPSFPRTSSVTSHRTGDSAQEEVKEKREWPPKSMERPATSISPPVPGPEQRISPASLTPPTPKDASRPSEPVLPSPPPEAKPSSHSPPLASPIRPTAVTARSPPPSQSKPTTTRPVSSTKSVTPKPTVRPSAAPPIKPSAAEGSVSPSSTPVKSHYTGQSATSAGASTRTAAKPRASAPPRPSATITPSRAKTPLSTARPKTPLSTARPKTPSSGLYAPTAASLARSKAGTSAPPPVEKPKRKITTDLSKPTAASASRIRSPAATPTRGGKPVTTKTTVTKAAAKPPVGKATTPSRQPAATKPRVGKPTVSQSKDPVTKKISSSSRQSAPVETVGSDAAIPVEAAAMKSNEQMLGDASESTASVIEDAVNIYPGDAVHEDEAHESLSPEDEPDDVDEQLVSHGEEEIENYDEDFPDDGRHEGHGEHENGHVEEIEAASGIQDEPSPITEPNLQQEVDAEDHGHSDTAREVREHPEDLKGIRPQSPPVSHDTSADLHHPDDIVQPEPHEDVELDPEVNKVNPKAIGTDLEDIVNLLESGPTVQRPSLGASPGGSAVSEAGEIPDEY